ncbi:MAG: DUF3180 domain-containing protein [Actinobacteria bacterium]|nr:DUF3180 domain-containing protein [Actinomycetota bacterium]
MPKLERTPVLTVAAFGMAGIATGVLVQVFQSTRGDAPFVPPASLPATLLVIAAVVLALGIALRRAVTRASARPVNPFHAVRLLAGARASQFAGSLLGGFGLGLLVQVMTRSVVPPSPTWLPMLFVAVSGVVLLVAGAIAEWLCRVPPDGSDAELEDDPGPETGEQLA